MKRLFEKRLQVQLLFALLAAAFMAALAVVFVSDAVRHAEGFVVADTSKNLKEAIAELDRQYRARTSSDTSWNTLPDAARDVSLRAISETVLSSYPGVEGGYFKGAHFLGYSFPTHDGGSPKIDVPEAERSEIEGVIKLSQSRGYAERVFRGRRDIVVVASRSLGGRSVWAMKRLAGQAERSRGDRDYLLAVLMAAALLSAAGVLATGVALHRGVSEIKRGLSRQQIDIGYELPERRDELGAIGAAINEMARTRRRLEAEVRREDRVRATGRLVAKVAHEMRNPLNNIRLSLELLSHRLEANKLKRDDFQTAMEEVDRMNRLLSDLLAFQQPRPPKVEATAVQPLLEHCLQLLELQTRKRKVAVTVESSGETTSALLDKQYAMQVLMNLLLNAIEVAPPDSTVTVAVSGGGSDLEIGVRDKGPGLSAEQQEHLFEPFYTTKADGHGLGLAVSRELARSMGGDLTYRASPEGGANFILVLRGVTDAA